MPFQQKQLPTWHCIKLTDHHNHLFYNRESEQETVNNHNKASNIKIKGRHDICIAPRVVPVVEAMIAIVLCDFILMDRSK